MPITNVCGRKVYFERHGDFDAPGATPLILIMGMAGSCAGWLPLQVPDFAKDRPVLIFDNRGAGRSDDPGTPFTTRDLAQDTLDLMDALDIERADVLGPFMGGMTAQELALLAPDRVDRLVLVGTYARPDGKRRMLLRHWSELIRISQSPEVMVYSRLLWTLQDETLEQRDLIDAMTQFFVDDDAPISGDAFIRQCEACARHDTRDRLGSLRQPTLILCGRHDILTPPSFHRELSDLIPDSRLVTLSYGGHLVMVESAERFNQIVLQFLDDER